MSVASGSHQDIPTTVVADEQPRLTVLRKFGEIAAEHVVETLEVGTGRQRAADTHQALEFLSAQVRVSRGGGDRVQVCLRLLSFAELMKREHHAEDHERLDEV